MKIIKLRSLKLKNFKCFHDVEFYLGKDNKFNVYGDNGTGKTTLVDSFLWLLFNKNSNGSSDFSIKPLDKKGNPLHNVDYSVSAVFEITEDNNKYNIELSKVMREKWTKKRGETTLNFSGHETTYYKDGSPKLLKDFQKEVEKLCDEELFRMLTSPFYFNKMNNKQKRAVLLKAIPDVSNFAVVETDPTLYPLLSELENLSVEELLAKYKANATSLNKELPSYGFKIEELHRMITTTSDTEDYKIIEDIENQIKNKREYISQLQEQKNLFNNTTEINRLNLELSDLRSKLQLLELNNSKTKNEKLLQLEQQITDIKSKNYSLQSLILKTKNDKFVLENEINDLKEDVEHFKNSIANTRELCREIDSQEFKGETTCPTCGQALPSEQIDNAISLFNIDKAERLEKAITKGKKLTSNLEETNLRLGNKINELSEYDHIIEGYEHEINNNNIVLDTLTSSETEIQNEPIELTEEMLEVKKEIENVLEQLEHTKNNSTSAFDVQQKVECEQFELDQLYSLKQTNQNNITYRQRITELAQQQEKIAKDYQLAMEKINLVERFLKAKVTLIENDINKLFSNVKFMMFREQINGGYEEVCNATINGVPFEDANNASKINAGLDIIKTLQRIENLKAPIFIDNAESVTKFEELDDTQIIKLYVKEGQDLLLLQAEKEN